MAGFTAAIGVGWVVSPIISLIINKTQTYISKKYFKKAGIETEMKQIETTLTEILAVMEAVEKQKIVEMHQVRLVHQIKEAVYDAEDVVDAFEYNILKDKSEKLQQKTVSYISSAAQTIRKLLVANDKFKKKVKEIGDNLDLAKVSSNTLLGLMKVTIHQPTHEFENSYVTSSHISDEIIGRVEECGLLIDLLLKQSNVVNDWNSGEGLMPTVIPIVGQGGIGKTTLVQMVFNDRKLEDKFDQKVWVTVSDNFNKIRLTKEILKHISVNFPTEEVNFDKLQKELEKNLDNKNVLLVLDDIWYDRDDSEQFGYKKEWLEVFAPFRKAGQGSKIILTTRMPIVGSILGTVSPIFIGGLSENDSWSLFEMCAFDIDNQQKRQKLEPIGKDIVNRLRGLPLAIRVLGTQLRGKSDMEQWRRTLNDNPLDTSDIMKILRRSYEHLPAHLKRCFAYCSLFPKNYPLKSDRLVHMWIAQGFIHCDEEKNLEAVAKSYFKALLARSFFQVIKQDSKEYYIMHDLLNDLACHVSKGECLIYNKGVSMKNLGSIRHLSLARGSLSFLNNIPDLDKLRTLIVLDPYGLKPEEMNFIIMLKRIRVLDVQLISEQNLLDIGECKHLRYLSFRVKTVQIPDCFRKLYHLSALVLRKEYKTNFPREVILPEFLCSMSRLVLVDTSKSLCMEVGRQSQLEQIVRRKESAYFHVKKKRGHQLDLLGNMNNIKGLLSISGLENVTNRKEAVKAQLDKKEHVVYLKLHWRYSSLKMNRSKNHEVIEALCPNSNLHSLEIDGYPGTAWPSWLDSNSLCTIKLIDLLYCKDTTIFYALGQLKSLQQLHLSGLAAMRRIDLECNGNHAFPSLRIFTISNLAKLEEISNCPMLCELTISCCPNFTGFGLDGFPTPQYLTIECSSWEMMTKAQKKLFQEHIFLPKLTNLEIVRCKGLITLNGLQKMETLQRLFIKDCPDLLSLPEKEFFNSLEFLAIFDCPTLNSFPKKGLPASLQLLCIGGTIHHVLEEQIQSKRGPDWDKVTAISGCDICASFEEWDLGLMCAAQQINHSKSFIEDDEDYQRILMYIVDKEVDAYQSVY